MGIPDTVDESFLLTADDTMASVSTHYREACPAAEEVASTHALDDLAMHHRLGPLSLRCICLHVVREHARHAGHGDILREQVLAAR